MIARRALGVDSQRTYECALGAATAQAAMRCGAAACACRRVDHREASALLRGIAR